MDRRGHIGGNSGFTLIEVMITILIFSLVVTGALAFHYHGAIEVRRADIRIGAARLAQTLLEGWRTTATPGGYDPVDTYGADVTISGAGSGPPAPTGFTALGTYLINENRVSYYATLSYKDKTATDPALLSVAIGWNPDGGAGDVSNAGQYSTLTSYD